MVYRFTIISDEVDNFRREIQIDSDATFLELHSAILTLWFRLDSYLRIDEYVGVVFVCHLADKQIIVTRRYIVV